MLIFSILGNIGIYVSKSQQGFLVFLVGALIIFLAYIYTSKYNKLLVSKKTNELALTSIDNLKVANLIVEKQQTEETTNNKGMLTGAAIGSFLGPLGALAGGLIGEMFSSSEEKTMSVNSESLLQPQPLISSDTSSTTSSTSINNNQNITSDENVVKILREAVTVLKAIQAKDTNVQLAVDGDVIARKITPNVSREQVKTYSSIG